MAIHNIMEIINKRYSCRSYTGVSLNYDDLNYMQTAIERAPHPPFATPMRFSLIAKQEGDSQMLKGLGTYGMLKGVPAYLAGIVKPGPNAMEDFGYVMESLVLDATTHGLGTCWLGGTFTKSAFAKRVGLGDNEQLAAIIAVGYPAEKPLLRERLTRTAAGSDRRLAWEQLFFDDDFSTPLDESQAAPYCDALTAVRKGPSASNKQPWRILKDGETWHFYVQRSPTYRRMIKTAGLVDLQRNDVGIAMCHWALALGMHNISGQWYHTEQYPSPVNDDMAYIVSWGLG